MHDLNVNINKAQVVSFHVGFKYEKSDEAPKVEYIRANVELFTQNGTKATSMEIASPGYYGDTKFKQEQIDAMQFDAIQMFKNLEVEVLRAINNIQHLIPQTASTETNYDSDITTPGNGDDVPF